MTRLAKTLFVLGLLPGLALPCEVKSGPRTTALVELYTSEGCSSCPPAEAKLAQLPGHSAAAIPLALHVPYWDYIGWKDRFAQAGFPRRQEWLAQANGSRSVYTPHFFVSGSELLGWNALEAAIRQVDAQPVRAGLVLRSRALKPGVLGLEAEASSTQVDAALFLAVAESGLSSVIKAGENEGRTLRHEHVVRHWIGPLPLVSGYLLAQKSVALPADWVPGRLDLVAFVQNMKTGEVLQAVAMAACPA